MKILLFLAKGFETMEASVFIDVMGWARNDYHHDVEVVTCGFQKTVISAFGVPVTVDLLLRDVCVDEYDALAIPGGFEEFGFYEEAFSKEFCDVIHKFNNQHKMIATVCVAALALAHSGILTGKKATTYHLNNGHRQKQLAEYGVEVVNEPVVKTDHIITSYCPQTAPEVAFVLLESLIGTEGMHIVKAAMGFASLCDMAVCKNQIPILEFDAEQSAVIMPGHHSDYHFPQKAVMLFMEPEIDDFVAQNKCEVVGKFESVTKNFYVYKTQINGIDIAFVQAPLGGAGAVMIMDQLIAGGVKEIIAAGCCGSLVEDTEGTFFVPTAALRQEGTSYHYLPSSREVELDAAPIEAICRVLEKAKLSYRTCKTWTTDGFYRETKEMVLYRKSEGYSVVEMECASLAACAKMRGVLFGQVLFTADSLADVDAHDIRNWGNDFFAAAMKIAMEAITEV